MKKVLSICLLMLGMSLPTFAQNWIEIGNKIYVDTDSVEQYVDDHGNTQRTQYAIWQKHLNDNSDSFKNIEKAYSKKVHYILSKVIIDVKTKKVSYKTIVGYGINGHVIDSSEQKDILLEWSSIVPGTVGETELEIVREYLNK